MDEDVQMEDATQGQKRPLGEDGGEKKPKKKRKSGGGGGIPLPKNALMQLNEMRPGLEYTVVSQSGPVHAPMFTMSVTVDGQVFQVGYKSKSICVLEEK